MKRRRAPPSSSSLWCFSVANRQVKRCNTSWEPGFCLGLLWCEKKQQKKQHWGQISSEPRGLWPNPNWHFNICLDESEQFVYDSQQNKEVSSSEPVKCLNIVNSDVSTCCWPWGHTGNRRAGGKSGPAGIERLESSAPPHSRARTGPRTPRSQTGRSGWWPAPCWPASSGTPGGDWIWAADGQTHMFNEPWKPHSCF